MLSYNNSIIASTAIVTSIAQRFYSRFDIQDITQLAEYVVIGTILGVTISKICNRKSSGLEKAILNN